MEHKSVNNERITFNVMITNQHAQKHFYHDHNQDVLHHNNTMKHTHVHCQYLDRCHHQQ